MTMDIQDEKNNIFNFKVAKFIGLYQMIDPGTVRFRGRNIYHIVMTFVLIYMCFISIMLNLNGVYNLTVNITISLEYFFVSLNIFYLIYKFWIVIRHSDDIWNCLSITRYSFTSFSHCNRHILDSWRKRLVWLTNIYAIACFLVSFFAVFLALAFKEDITAFKNYNGSIGYYRPNVVNLHFIVSDETYNSNYYLFFFIEALFVYFFGLLFFMFDFLLITLCFGMNCQMQIIINAFKSAGYKSHSLIDDQAKSTKIQPNEHILIYDELKTILMNHQTVLGKFEGFLNLFGRMMLVQVFSSSISLIGLWFNFIMGFSNDERYAGSMVTFKNSCCAIPPILFEMFMVCYLFGNINDQKDSIIFTLYSSNWTEMDMKCKKLILLIMKLNNANHKKLKFTATKIVNLEMFFKTMRDCYTVVSVLVNYLQSKR